MKVRISSTASRDLHRTYPYLADRNPKAAEDFIRRINQKFEQLAELPFIGRQRSTLAPGLRSVLVGNHLIFYLVGTNIITIVRVIDGRMDIDEELRR